MSNIQMHPVESSQIAAIGYHPESQTLAVEFKNSGKQSDPKKPIKNSVYYYANVTPEDYEAFESAASIGSHFYAHFKPHPKKYPYTKQG